MEARWHTFGREDERFVVLNAGDAQQRDLLEQVAVSDRGLDQQRESRACSSDALFGN